MRRDGSVAAHAELDLWGVTVVADEAGSFEVLTAGSRAGEARIAVTVRAAGCTARTEEIVFTPSSLTDGTLVVLHDFELAPVASSATMSAALS